MKHWTGDTNHSTEPEQQSSLQCCLLNMRGNSDLEAKNEDDTSPTKHFKSMFARTIVTQLENGCSMVFKPSVLDEDKVISECPKPMALRRSNSMEQRWNCCKPQGAGSNSNSRCASALRCQQLQEEIKSQSELWRQREQDMLQLRKESQHLLEENRNYKKQLAGLRKENSKLRQQLSQNAVVPSSGAAPTPQEVTWCIKKAEASRNLYESAIQQVLQFLEQVQGSLNTTRPSSSASSPARSPHPSPARRKRGFDASRICHLPSGPLPVTWNPVSGSGRDRPNHVLSGLSNRRNGSMDSEPSNSSRSQSPASSELAEEAGHLINSLRRLVDVNCDVGINSNYSSSTCTPAPSPMPPTLASDVAPSPVSSESGCHSLPATLPRKDKARKDVMQKIHWV